MALANHGQQSLQTAILHIVSWPRVRLEAYQARNRCVRSMHLQPANLQSLGWVHAALKARSTIHHCLPLGLAAADLPYWGVLHEVVPNFLDCERRV